MFVRWKKRPIKVKDYSKYKLVENYWGATVREYDRNAWKDGPDYSLAAYLVESYRNDEGKPRQRNIAYLGSVKFKKDWGFPPPAAWRIWKKFYETVDANQIDDESEAKLAAKIADKIGMMSRDQLAERLDEIDKKWAAFGRR